MLIGTVHSPLDNNSNRVQDQFLSRADLIVEHPLPMGTRRSERDRTVTDITQGALVHRASGLETRLIGADGRKVIDRHGRSHAISIKSQPQKLRLRKPVSSEKLLRLASEYIDASLGLAPVDIGRVIMKVVNFGTYEAAKAGYRLPDIGLVLRNSFKRVRTITEYFEGHVKLAIKQKVLSHLRAAIDAGTEGANEQLAACDNYYKSMDQLSEKDQLDWTMAVNDLTEQIQVDAIAAFHDAICNLTLFSEALASDKSNLVVAFGGDHVRPLNELMHDVNGTHKHYSLSLIESDSISRHLL